MQKVASEHDFSNVRIPSEAEDLWQSSSSVSNEGDPHLFLSFPKVRRPCAYLVCCVSKKKKGGLGACLFSS
jgi:hypothetical protein